MSIELAKSNSPEDIEDYRKDALRTILMYCPSCGNNSRFTVNEANDRLPCQQCRNKGRA